jgi:hypothetical protein
MYTYILHYVRTFNLLNPFEENLILLCIDNIDGKGMRYAPVFQYLISI